MRNLTLKSIIMNSKTIGWVSYLTFIGWIIAFVSYNNSIVKSSFATLHLRQSFGIVIASSLAVLVVSILFGSWGSIYWILRVLVFVLWLGGFITAVQGEERTLPVVGPLFQRWFSFIR